MYKSLIDSCKIWVQYDGYSQNLCVRLSTLKIYHKLVPISFFFSRNSKVHFTPMFDIDPVILCIFQPLYLIYKVSLCTLQKYLKIFYAETY